LYTTVLALAEKRGRVWPFTIAREARMKVEQMLVQKRPRIISVRMDETVETAARMLRRENIGAVVVKDVCGTEGDTVVGILSERDFLRAIVDAGPAVLKKPVASLMSRPVVSCSPEDDLDYVVSLLNRHHIRHVPVVERGALIGVVSIRDVIAVQSGHTVEPELERSVA
jgi:CBS domain-containing protein